MTEDRIAVCKTCGRQFPVNQRHTITFDGRIYAHGHRNQNDEPCLDNSAKIPNYEPRRGDVRPFMSTPEQPG